MGKPKTNPVLPPDWRSMLDALELQTDDPRAWARLKPEFRQRAEQFNADRAAGLFGASWQSATERARMAQAAVAVAE